MRGSNSNGNLESNASLQNELELLLLQTQHNRNLLLERERERERDLNINRSGSAPPTVEGALRSAGNLFRNPNFVQVDDSGSSSNNNVSLSALTEEDIRSHPAYLEYYYSNENLNPRLPPPLLSKEDWRVVQRFREAGGSLGSSGDWRNNNLVENGGSSSLFSTQPGLFVKKAEDDLMELRKAALRNITRKNSAADLLDKSSTGSAGASGSGMPVRRKSFADIVQEGRGQPATTSLSRPASQNSLGDALDSMGVPNTRVADMQSKRESLEAMLSEKAFTGLSSTQNSVPSSFASSASSSLRGRGTELLGRSSSAGLFSIGNGPHLADNINYVTSDVRKGPSSGIFEIADIAASLSGLSMSNNQLRNEDILKTQMGMTIGHRENPQQHYFDNSRAEMLVNNMNLADLAGNNEPLRSLNISKSLMNERVSFPRRSSSTNNLQSLRNPSDIAILEDLKIRSQGISFAGVDISSQRHSGYNGNGKSGTMTNNDIAAGTFLTGDGNNRKNSHQTGNHSPVMDPRHIQYNPGTSSEGRCLSNAYDPESLQALEKAYLEALLVQQKQQYQSYLLQKSSGVNQYHANPAFGPSAAAYQGNQILNSLHSSSKNSMFPNEKSAQFPSTLGSINVESSGALQSQSGNNIKGRFESLLEAVKNNKTKSLELLDVLNHVVEFSTDQYGSRFIQQKLETATVEEKMKIFREILPHARNLMIDVFGNYVIQKFIEHGTDSQRMELARHVIGHVLPLSLQMYGCRVIQKTLEVVDVEMQTQMVAELDGSVMKCVRDQNGNHVIQKCIECVPQDRIQFIVTSFFGQVVNLSTHPYGCRVIQRVLEHCVDPKTQQIIMDEIMGAVCNLARDQYGNYVIQHVLQHGKPHERSAIITKLAGQIVRMSQQKFASNVVEKCLTFGGPEERKILVNEMLGSTDENEPLQAMMKDPFGNYVVQKVLETCDDRSRQLIISRIKVHLHTLKKYTYGKHIVSRVEKLITTGEKHSGQPSSNAT